VPAADPVTSRTTDSIDTFVISRATAATRLTAVEAVAFLLTDPVLADFVGFAIRLETTIDTMPVDAVPPGTLVVAGTGRSAVMAIGSSVPGCGI